MTFLPPVQVRHVQVSIGNKEMSFLSSSLSPHAMGTLPGDSNQKWIRSARVPAHAERGEEERCSFVSPDSSVSTWCPEFSHLRMSFLFVH